MTVSVGNAVRGAQLTANRQLQSEAMTPVVWVSFLLINQSLLQLCCNLVMGGGVRLLGKKLRLSSSLSLRLSSLPFSP